MSQVRPSSPVSIIKTHGFKSHTVVVTDETSLHKDKWATEVYTKTDVRSKLKLVNGVQCNI